MKVFTSGFGSKILVYNYQFPSITLEQEIPVQDGYSMSYAFYSPQRSSLYTVHEPLEDADNRNGTVARWEVDFSEGKPIMTRKEVKT